MQIRAAMKFDGLKLMLVSKEPPSSWKTNGIERVAFRFSKENETTAVCTFW